jgi:hypothetical protein
VDGTATGSTLPEGTDPAVLQGCPDCDRVPYKREVKQVAKVLTIRDGKSAKLEPSEIKDAGLQARVEAGMSMPESDKR